MAFHIYYGVVSLVVKGTFGKIIQVPKDYEPVISFRDDTHGS